MNQYNRTSCLGVESPYNINNERQCGKCGKSNNQFVFILKKERFTDKPTKYQKKKWNKVCLRCACELFATRMYLFGTYWEKILINELKPKTQSRFFKKYPEIKKQFNCSWS